MFGRVLVIAILVMTITPVSAQFGNIPGAPPSRPEFGLPPWPPPAKCVALKGILSDMRERSQAISAANERKAGMKVICELFHNFLSAATNAVKALEADGPSCGAPPQVKQQLHENQAAEQKLARQVCNLAAREPADAGPPLRWGPDLRREFDDPSWRLHPTPTFEGPRPFRMSPQRGL